MVNSQAAKHYLALGQFKGWQRKNMYIFYASTIDIKYIKPHDKDKNGEKFVNKTQKLW